MARVTFYDTVALALCPKEAEAGEEWSIRTIDIDLHERTACRNRFRNIIKWRNYTFFTGITGISLVAGAILSSTQDCAAILGVNGALCLTLACGCGYALWRRARHVSHLFNTTIHAWP